MPRTAAPVAGHRFGHLQVLREAKPINRSSPSKKRQLERRVVCQCDCGIVKNISLQAIRKGETVSCGCHRDKMRFESKSHGDAGHGRVAPEYRAWSAMISRCENVKQFASYKNYGGRGIKVCQRWRDSYEVFLADMGRRPPDKYSIDRINNSGNYEPGNCRWATRKEQARNKSITLHVNLGGELIPLAEACERMNLKYCTIVSRIGRGWSEMDALTRPVRFRP